MFKSSLILERYAMQKDSIDNREYGVMMKLLSHIAFYLSEELLLWLL